MTSSKKEDKIKHKKNIHLNFIMTMRKEKLNNYQKINQNLYNKIVMMGY